MLWYSYTASDVREEVEVGSKEKINPSGFLFYFIGNTTISLHLLNLVYYIS